jgi:hypothetical protein
MAVDGAFKVILGEAGTYRSFQCSLNIPPLSLSSCIAVTLSRQGIQIVTVLSAVARSV